MAQDLRTLQQQSQSAASNPGQMRVNYLQYARCFPKWPLIWFGFFVVSILLVLVHWAFAVLVLAAIAMNVFYWRRVRALFIAGCINPGRIVSLEPPLIAVATNLAKGPGADCTAIKVLPHPLARMRDIALRVGEPLGTIAFYGAWTDEATHWNDFDPIAVNAATSSSQEIQRILATLGPDDWSELDRGLQQLPQPFESGMYRTFVQQTPRLSPQELPNHRQVAQLVEHRTENPSVGGSTPPPITSLT